MENNIDKLFKSKLEGQEPDFHPAAWDRMESLLDEEGLVANPENKPRRVVFIFIPILLFGIILSIVGYMNLNPSELVSEGSTLTSSIELNNNSVQLTDKSNNKPTQTLSILSSINTQQKITAQNNSADHISSPKHNNLDIKQPGKITSKGEKRNVNLTQNEHLDIHGDVFTNEVNSETPGKVIFSPPTPTINIDLRKTEDYIGTQMNDKESDGVKIVNSSLSFVDENISLNKSNKSIDENVNPIIEKSRLLDIGFINNLPFLGLFGNESENMLLPALKIVPQQKMIKSSLFEIGIRATSRFNNGFGYAVGPFVSYNIGRGYTLGIGGQFDVQRFKSAPELSVFDKEYSFGSTLIERKFSMDNQKSVRIPISIRSSFKKIDLSAGLVFYKILMSGGEIAESSDGSISLGQSINNQLIKPQNISFQLETAFNLNRYLKLGLGLEYKPKVFSEDQTTSNNQNTIYPTLGLQYTFFKI